MTASIPLIRASQVVPFAEAIAAAGWRTDPLLETSGVRPDLPAGDPEALVPEYAVWRFVDRCARTAGAATFGWDVGLGSPIERMGAFGREVGAAATLREAILLFLEAASKHSSHADFSLEPRADAIWFRRHGIRQIDVGAWQVELYVLGLMVRLVRLALGSAWVPTPLLLKAPVGCANRIPEALQGADVRWGQTVTAIPIPLSALDERLACRPREAAVLEPIDLDLTASLKETLAAMLGAGSTRLQDVAQCAGVSGRTLQRRLEGDGRTFASILEEVQRQAAMHLLRTTHLRLADIATRLGYGDPANFTRAFRRWTGRPPSAVRRRHGRGE